MSILGRGALAAPMETLVAAGPAVVARFKPRIRWLRGFRGVEEAG